MRPISGLERPWAQWLLVALSVLLIALAAWGAIGLRRASREIERIKAADLEARVEREQIERRLAREQSTRESLALELARHRTRAAEGSAPPTLTLWPLRTRGSIPPEATVALPSATQVIDVRLVLPRGVDRRHAQFHATMRSWSGGDTIWTRGRLTASSLEGRPTVVARVPGDVFQPGAYEIALTAGSGGAAAGVASYEVTIGNER
jgi:hypothetical protein